MRAWKKALGIGTGGALLALTGGSIARAGTVVIEQTGPAGHRYEVVMDDSSNWNHAAADARARGGYLATIDDADQQTFVEGLLTQSNAPTGSYWMGYHETGSEGTYQFVTDVPSTYSHWLPGQPDNRGGHETAASILWSHPGDPTISRQGFWNDLPNAGGYPQVASTLPDLTSRGYVVEFPGSGAQSGSGGSSGNGSGGGSAVPLPAALLTFPAAAFVAGYAARRRGR